MISNEFDLSLANAVYTFFAYRFSRNEYNTLTCSNSAFSSNFAEVGMAAWALFDATRSSGCMVEGLNLLSMRRRMTVWKETLGRKRSTGHWERIR